MLSTHPKHSGERIEGEVVQLVDGLRWVSDKEQRGIDAEATTPIYPSPSLRLDGVCVIETGTPVEIKSASVRLASGLRGRFYVRQQQHEKLVASGGVYLLAVYAPTDHDVLAMAAVPASVVSERVPSWREVDGRYTYAQITWTRFIPPTAVPREGGEAGAK